MPKRKNTPFVYTITGLLLALCMFGDSISNGASSHSPLANHLTCHFFHANLFHLAANALCLFLMRPYPKQLLHAYPIAVLSTFCSDIPTVGISAIIYAYIGLNIIYWRLSNYDLLTFIIANIITIFIPNIATTMHMVSFFVGLICAMLYRRYEYRRVNR